MNDYKRQYRELDQETKQKISDSSRNKPKSEEQKKRISQGMLKYWEGIVRFVILQIAMFFPEILARTGGNFVGTIWIN